MTLGIVAADPYELEPYSQRLTSVTGFRQVGRSAASGTTAEGDTVRMTAFGPGFRAAARGAESILSAGPVDVLISTGTCGALSPELSLFDIVVDARDHQPVTEAAFRSGRVVSQDRVASTAEEKAALAAEGLAVEMESAAVREAASRQGVKFACIKCVSDTSGESLPLDFNRYRAEDGGFRKWRIAGAILTEPLTLIPAIGALQRQSRQAAQTLGGFLAGCRF
jgi:adenosylhomocysteine nucleosidase